MNKFGLWAAVVTAVLALVGGAFTAIVTAKPGTIEACYNRTSALELRLDRLQSENTTLVVELAERINTQEVLEVVLDGIHHPVWAKERITLDTPNEFGHYVQYEMLYVNEAYQEVFGISAEQYRGKTDYEAGWTKAEHVVFHNNDEIAFKAGSIRTTESFRANVFDPEAPLVKYNIDKNSVTLPNGKEVIIGFGYKFDV